MTAISHARLLPSRGLVRAAEALMVAMSNEQVVRPIVEAYEHAILAKHQFKLAQRWKEFDMPQEIILDRKSTFLMEDEDFKVYNAECFAARDAAGLKVSRPENCPLLEAEYLRVQAENALIKELGNIEGLETFKTANSVMTLDMRKSVIEIGLLMALPAIDNADGVLRRYMNG